MNLQPKYSYMLKNNNLNDITTLKTIKVAINLQPSWLYLVFIYMLKMMLAAVFFPLLGSTCLPATVTANKKVSYKECNIYNILYIVSYHQIQVASETILLPYHQLMTPSWLQEHSTITGPHSFSPRCLELLPTTADFQQRLQVQLVAPNILTSTDCISVTITVAMNTTLADSGDHDFICGISDEKSFVGLAAVDKGNYPDQPPCFPYEGDIVNGILSNKINYHYVGLPVTSRLYSSEVKMQIRPTEQWGSCHTEHDEGHTTTGNYQRKLDLTKGLYLDVYQADKPETYQIKYIVVDVNVD